MPSMLVGVAQDFPKEFLVGLGLGMGRTLLDSTRAFHAFWSSISGLDLEFSAGPLHCALLLAGLAL